MDSTKVENIQYGIGLRDFSYLENAPFATSKVLCCPGHKERIWSHRVDWCKLFSSPLVIETTSSLMLYSTALTSILNTTKMLFLSLPKAWSCKFRGYSKLSCCSAWQRIAHCLQMERKFIFQNHTDFVTTEAYLKDVVMLALMPELDQDENQADLR